MCSPGFTGCRIWAVNWLIGTDALIEIYPMLKRQIWRPFTYRNFAESSFPLNFEGKNFRADMRLKVYFGNLKSLKVRFEITSFFCSVSSDLKSGLFARIICRVSWPHKWGEWTPKKLGNPHIKITRCRPGYFVLPSSSSLFSSVSDILNNSPALTAASLPSRTHR